MLFLESKTLNHPLDTAARITLLQELQERSLVPLIRSQRLRVFEHVLLGVDHITEMENALAASTESTTGEPYVRGDLFCLHDYILFLVFDDDDDSSSFIRAGIVYEANTPEPFRKLDTFCQDIRSLLYQPAERRSFPDWQTKHARDAARVSNLCRATGRRLALHQPAQGNDEQAHSRGFETRRRKRARLSAHRAQRAPGRLRRQTADRPHGIGGVPIQRLEDAGLVEREVQISCRKTGHALFRLPNPHALAVVTVSDATCSECGAPVADENVEEVIAPTQLASSLLEDGSWLVSRIHFLLREMGVPEREIAVGPTEGNGYGQLMANICGESFLIVTRDGDLTPAFARWVIDLEIDTEASHLVIVATGRIHKEAGMLLQNHSRRRVSSGQDFEMIIADDAASAGRELEQALERVSQRVVAEQLCVLDGSVGFSVSRLVLTKISVAANRNAERCGSCD
jgi:hypothetical protein